MFEVYINMLQHIEKDIQNKHFFMSFFFILSHVYMVYL